MLKLPELMEQNLRVEEKFSEIIVTNYENNEYKYGGVLMTKPYYNKDKMILVHADTFAIIENETRKYGHELC